MGSDPRPLKHERQRSNFNPRSRVGSDILISLFCRHDNGISIHAPAWGATCHSLLRHQTYNISIHAPAWGATATSMPLALGASEFQSTLPRGERQLPPMIRMTNQLFQSTLPRGERRCRFQAHGRGCSNFNPRSRVGSDFSRPSTEPTPSSISIHAPAWGATCTGPPSVEYPKNFNPRSRVGSDIRYCY